MMIDSISPAINTLPPLPQTERTAPVQTQPNRDTFIRTEPVRAGTPPEAEKAAKNLMDENSERTASAKSMLRDFIGSDESISSDTLVDAFAENVDYDVDEAEQLFSTLGNIDWNSRSTADMIYEMAKEISDGEPEMMELMKSAVSEAFTEVEKSFGGSGKLPSEAYATMKRLNEMFCG